MRLFEGQRQTKSYLLLLKIKLFGDCFNADAITLTIFNYTNKYGHLKWTLLLQCWKLTIFLILVLWGKFHKSSAYYYHMTPIDFLFGYLTYNLSNIRRYLIYLQSKLLQGKNGHNDMIFSFILKLTNIDKIIWRPKTNKELFVIA